MADAPSRKDSSAEKAYATASAATKPVSKPALAKAEPKPAAKPVKKARGKPEAKKPVSAAAPKPAAAPKVGVAVKTAPVETPLPSVAGIEAPKSQENLPPVPNNLKDTPMATQPNTDFLNTVNAAMGEMQTRAKSAYEKSTEVMAEVSDLTKGNVEAVVESGRIFAGGVQDLGKSYVDEAKSAYEQLTADMKEMASVKSPTELFQLQGKIMRRNFDALVAAGSKNTEAMIKLANDSFAPISGRVNVAAEKIAKVN